MKYCKLSCATVPDKSTNDRNSLWGGGGGGGAKTYAVVIIQ